MRKNKQRKLEQFSEICFKAILKGNNAFYHRTDLWSMFVDLEVKHGSIDKAREILERSLTVSLKKKKLITILKKYYQIEEVHGTPESAAKILERAKALADEYA